MIITFSSRLMYQVLTSEQAWFFVLRLKSLSYINEPQRTGQTAGGSRFERVHNNGFRLAGRNDLITTDLQRWRNERGDAVTVKD